MTDLPQLEMLFVPPVGTTVWWVAGPFCDQRTVRGKVVSVADYEQATGVTWPACWTGNSLPIFTDQASERGNQWRSVLIKALSWE